jgi:hypothetical protein
VSRQEGHELLAGVTPALRLVPGILGGASVRIEDVDAHFGNVYAASDVPVTAVRSDEHGMNITDALFRKAA